MMLTSDATGYATHTLPNPHFPHRNPHQHCGHRPVPPTGPGPFPDHLPPSGPGPMPFPAPPVPGGYGPARPTTMQQLAGRSIGDIARGIIALYDADGNGRISADEAVRVQRQHGMHGLMIPGGGGTRVDVYAMTRLLVSADANGNGKVGVGELTRFLRRFDTGDNWSSKFGVRTGAGDGRLTGSEFQRFMERAGERHVAGWNEPSWGYKDPWYGWDSMYGHPRQARPPLAAANATSTPPATSAGAANGDVPPTLEAPANTEAAAMSQAAADPSD
jgi:hypothetical protein